MKDKEKYKEMVTNIQRELEAYLAENKLQSLVLGISGGIDSALCAALAKPVCDKLKIPLIGRSIPITTNTSEERNRADLIGKAFCTNYDEAYQVEGPYKEVWNMMKMEAMDAEDPKENLRAGNVKARMRMIYLYDLAQLHNGMVLSTDNYTEYLLGFFTIFGDQGDFGMIQNLWKTEVYDMSEYLTEFLSEKQAKALQLCIDCEATDGLGISNTDLDQIMPGWEGTSRDGYAEVDKKLQGFNMLLKDAAKTPSVIKAMKKLSESPVIQRYLRTEFKRNHPINIKRSIVIPAPEKVYERKQIEVVIHQHNQDKPYTAEYLDNLSLLPDDEISISWQDTEIYSDSESPAGWYIQVSRTRIETSEEFKERMKNEKYLSENLKKRRYENYLKLKEEFEK